MHDQSIGSVEALEAYFPSCIDTLDKLERQLNLI